MPDGDETRGGGAAEEAVVFDEGDGKPGLGGADGGEDAGAATADDADVGCVADGNGAGGEGDCLEVHGAGGA